MKKIHLERNVIVNGRSYMPGEQFIQDEQLSALVDAGATEIRDDPAPAATSRRATDPAPVTQPAK